MEILKLKQSEFVPRNYTGIIEWEGGVKAWYKEMEYHREDGPAIKCKNETNYWYINGKLHRVDGPAIEYTDGYKEWYINGNLFGIGLLNFLVFNFLYVGKEKGKYDLYWLKFMTETGIKEFPIMSGMKDYHFMAKIIEEFNSLVGEEVF